MKLVTFTDSCDKSRGRQGAHPRNRGQPPARRVLLVISEDLRLDRASPDAQIVSMREQRFDCHSGGRRRLLRSRDRQSAAQIVETRRAFGCYQTVLAKQPANGN
jgi:hypothetical protein